MGEVADLYALIKRTATAPVGGEVAAEEVSTNLNELEGSTTYVFRVLAENEVGTDTGDDLEFTTFGFEALGDIEVSQAPQANVSLATATATALTVSHKPAATISLTKEPV